MSRLWEKGEPLDELVLRFTAGEDHRLDNRLVEYDVVASIAHAEMLNQCGHLAAADLESIRTGLRALADEHEAGTWEVTVEDEDVHTALERRLTERIGDAGARIHLGRSRNDQVLAALRLYLRDEIQALSEDAGAVAEALHELAGRYPDTPLPGYTHLQRAMPSSVALWAAGFAAELLDDAECLSLVGRRVEKNPLGSAAGYGTPGLEIDREMTREQLAFETVHEPVTAVQLSRGKAEAHLAFEIVILLQDLGRLAADVILFNTSEFGFVALTGSVTTGSSIMPQKRNPDVFELVRGRSATAVACLHEVLGVTAKLTSGYHRDLQLIKAPLFRAIDLAHDMLQITAHALAAVHFRPDRIRLGEELFATEEAYRLVQEEGLTFREAYRKVARRFADPD
jgi:argininosuccinate lyase